MEVKYLAADVLSYKVLIQTLKFKDAVFVNVSNGEQQSKLEHLAVAVPTRFVRMSDSPRTRYH